MVPRPAPTRGLAVLTQEGRASANIAGTYTLRFTATDALGHAAFDDLTFVWQDVDSGLFSWIGVKKAAPISGNWYNLSGGSGTESSRDGALKKQDWIAASENFVMQGSNDRISKFDVVTGEFLGYEPMAFGRGPIPFLSQKLQWTRSNVIRGAAVPATPDHRERLLSES